MKLRNKLLTVLPIATMGAISPIVISGCSCGNSYSIAYGDNINCKDQNNKDITYHTIDSVKQAALNHVQNPQEGLAPKDWSSYTIELPQDFYWDLVYSAASNGIAFTLIWNFKQDSKQKLVDGGDFNGTIFTKLVYARGEGNKYWICADNETKPLVQSYMYSLS